MTANEIAGLALAVVGIVLFAAFLSLDHKDPR